MIPILDTYIQNLIVNGLQYLKQNPKSLESIFSNLYAPGNLESFKSYIAKKNFNVVIGFPREPQSLPCYVILIAGEQEEPCGLGDSIEEDWDDEIAIPTIYINSTYRIECWSDNGELTAYMYAILKWCLLNYRFDMLQQNMINPKISGTDLEPAPDYFPMFVYRRAVMLQFSIENSAGNGAFISVIDSPEICSP